MIHRERGLCLSHLAQGSTAMSTVPVWARYLIWIVTLSTAAILGVLWPYVRAVQNAARKAQDK